MRKFIIPLILMLTFLTGCGESNSVEEVNTMKIKIYIGDKIFNATLDDNESARAFAEKLPLDITMTELNGNEKYYRFSERLPSNDKVVGAIHTGDLMLYSASYVVLFYKDFSTTYNYTRLGRIDNSASLTTAVGKGNINVRIEK